MKICPKCNSCYEDADISCTRQGHGLLKKGRPGTRIIADKYRLERLLGIGTMGVVYQSAQLDSAQVRAVKLLKPEYINKDPKAIARFRKEFQTGDLVGHQNLVRVYDYFELDPDEACIVMEFIEGESLRDYIRRQEKLPMPLAEAILIASQTALGIDALHHKHILHCDLKPENIMLTKDQQSQLLIKVVDFGLAKSLKSLCLPRYSSDAHIKEFVGTMLYTSPENCRGEGLDERSDIYSLGVILYEMLAGRPPFLGRSIEVERQHRVDCPIPITSLRHDVPPALAELVMKALNKEPQARPRSAKDIADILHFIVLTPTDKTGHSISPVKTNSASTVAVYEPIKPVKGKRVHEKQGFSQKLKEQGTPSAEQLDEPYINITIMKPSKDNDRNTPLVLNRQAVIFPERNKTKNVTVMILLTLLLCIGLVSTYLFYKYRTGRFERYVEAGLAHLETNENEKAIEAFSEAILLDATQFKPYYYRAVAKYEKGDQEGAIQDYSEVIRLSPNYVLAYQNRANIYSVRGEHEKAIEDYTKMLGFAPNANTYQLRGNMYFKKKDYNQAIADYTEASRLDSNNPNIFDSRSAAYNKRGGKGDRELANSDLRTARQLRQ